MYLIFTHKHSQDKIVMFERIVENTDFISFKSHMCCYFIVQHKESLVHSNKIDDAVRYRYAFSIAYNLILIVD